LCIMRSVDTAGRLDPPEVQPLASPDMSLPQALRDVDRESPPDVNRRAGRAGATVLGERLSDRRAPELTTSSRQTHVRAFGVQNRDFPYALGLAVAGVLDLWDGRQMRWLEPGRTRRARQPDSTYPTVSTRRVPI
jgi:hypothetical protein